MPCKISSQSCFSDSICVDLTKQSFIFSHKGLKDGCRGHKRHTDIITYVGNVSVNITLSRSVHAVLLLLSHDVRIFTLQT